MSKPPSKKIEVREEAIRCLVTGCAGFIGSHVTDLLLKHGYHVIGIDDLSSGKVENMTEHSNFQFINGDIRDLSLFNLLGEVDYVFHLAAFHKVQMTIEDPVKANYINVNGTLNVLEYCRKHKAKVILSSTAAVYDDRLSDALMEISPTNPKNPYGLQKLFCEGYVNLYRGLYGVQGVVLRYFNVFGERQVTTGGYAAITGIFMDQKAAGKPLTITGDGEQRRDFVYVKDVARANLLAMDWMSNKRTNIYNIGSGKSYSINELAEAVGGKKKYIRAREGEARQLLADNILAVGLGWEPSKDVKDWVHDQVQS